MSTPINDGGHDYIDYTVFSNRVSNVLKEHNIRTWDELCSKSDFDLLRLRSFGRTSLEEVKARLLDRGRVFGQPNRRVPQVAQQFDLRDYFAARAMQGMYAYYDHYEPEMVDADFAPVDDPKPDGYYWFKTRHGSWRGKTKRNDGDSGPHRIITSYESRIARDAYKQADAMLAAREAK